VQARCKNSLEGKSFLAPLVVPLAAKTADSYHGGYRVVRRLDASTGEVTKTVAGCADQVQCVAWSSDGKCLAAAGGVLGQAGEVVLFDAQTWKPVRTLIGHTEVVYAVTICQTVPLKIALIYPPGSIMFIPTCLT
jgi:WD40 repeat protein